jgi:hypothetical protein
MMRKLTFFVMVLIVAAVSFGCQTTRRAQEPRIEDRNNESEASVPVLSRGVKFPDEPKHQPQARIHGGI